MKLINCEIASIADKREEVKKFSFDEIESLAEFNHEEWVKERISFGWTYSPYRDVEKKLSPYFVPWEELSDEIKEFDRDPIRNIPKILNLIAMKVVRSDIDNFNEDLFKNELAKLKNENNQFYEKNYNFEKEINEDKAFKNNSFENSLANDENKEKKAKKKKGFFSRLFKR